MRKVLILTAAIIGFGLAPASAEVILDYRDDAFLSGSPFYSASQRRDIEAALKKAPGDISKLFGEKFVVRGDASGAFTADGAQERVFLVQQKAAMSSEPFPDAAAPLLLVMRGKEPVGFHLLPGDTQYQRLVAAADVNADGRDEVFLETSFMTMGTIVMSVDVVSVEGEGPAKIIQTLKEVYSDSCEAPMGEKSKTASAISVDNGLQTESFKEPCPQ